MKITKLMIAHAANIKKLTDIRADILTVCKKCGHMKGYHSRPTMKMGVDLRCPPKGFQWNPLGSPRTVIYKRNVFVLDEAASEIFILYLRLLGMVIRDD